jgi:hypothetical protein
MGICNIVNGVNAAIEVREYDLKLGIKSDNGGEAFEQWVHFSPGNGTAPALSLIDKPRKLPTPNIRDSPPPGAS